MNTATLTQQLAALPGSTVRAADHAAVGYDLEAQLPEASLLDAVTIMDAAGYFLEGMTGIDWLGECAALRKAAETKAQQAAAQNAAADSASSADEASSATATPAAEQGCLPQEDELEVAYDFNLFSARHRVILRVRTPRTAPQMRTIASIYPIAHWHEREIHEFFGIVFIGHPYLNHRIIFQAALISAQAVAFIFLRVYTS